MMYSDIKYAMLITKPNFEVKLLFLNALSFLPSSGANGVILWVYAFSR